MQVSGPFVRSGLIVLMSFAATNAPALAQPADLVFDGDQRAQTFLGFGAQVWAGDAVGQSVLTDLDIRYARVHHGVNFFSFGQQPPSDTDLTLDNNWQAMRDYIGANFNGPNDSEPWHLPSIQNTFSHAAANGVEIILNEFQIPHGFLVRNDTVLPESRVDDFATYWSAMIDYLDDNGMRPKYIELANEPDITNNGRISTENYNTLVKLTRQSLDARGFADVGIVGPGLTQLGDTSRIDGLDAQAVGDLAAFTTHAWDDDLGIASRMGDFAAAANAKDPNKPVFITEYATDKFEFNGTTYGDPDIGGNATDAAAFATQVFHNTLVMINHGANAPVLWEAADQSWNSLAWGLRREDGSDRPTLLAMQTLMDRVTDDTIVLEKVWDDSQLTAAAFFGAESLTVAIANITASDAARSLGFMNLGSLELLDAILFSEGAVQEASLALLDGEIDVFVPAESTLTLTFAVTVPEPATAAVLGLALFGLLSSRRRI